MSLIKVTVDGGRRLDIAAAHVVSVLEGTENSDTEIGLSTGETVRVKESGRSVRGYVKKALAASDAAEKPAF